MYQDAFLFLTFFASIKCMRASLCDCVRFDDAARPGFPHFNRPCFIFCSWNRPGKNCRQGLRWRWQIGTAWPWHNDMGGQFHYQDAFLFDFHCLHKIHRINAFKARSVQQLKMKINASKIIESKKRPTKISMPMATAATSRAIESDASSVPSDSSINRTALSRNHHAVSNNESTWSTPSSTSKRKSGKRATFWLIPRCSGLSRRGSLLRPARRQESLVPPMRPTSAEWPDSKIKRRNSKT